MTQVAGSDGVVRSRAVSEVTELRVALTVADFDAAVALYRDGLGLEQLADWSTENGRVVVFSAGRATLELFDEAQASYVDELEVGRRVSGPVRLAFEVGDSAEAALRLVAAGAAAVAPAVVTPWGDRNARVEGPGAIQLTLFTPPAGEV
jgi:lactoylglutathione lyase